MQLFAFYIVKYTAGDEKAYILCATHDFSSYSYLKRAPMKEMCAFLCRNLVYKLATPCRQVVTHEDVNVCVIKYEDGLSFFAATDKDYPSRIAFQALSKVNTSFRSTISSVKWRTTTKDYDCEFHSSLKSTLKEYSDPLNFDALVQTDAKVTAAQDEVKKTIEQVYQNMTNLDELMKKSEDVSATTQELYKQSKKMKTGCCKVM